MGFQEIATGLIVASSFVISLFTVFRSVLAEPVSRWLLSRGKVKAAMRFRTLTAPGSSCGTSGGCSSSKCH
jgi:hypothetical protein